MRTLQHFDMHEFAVKLNLLPGHKPKTPRLSTRPFARIFSIHVWNTGLDDISVDACLVLEGRYLVMAKRCEPVSKSKGGRLISRHRGHDITSVATRRARQYIQSLREALTKRLSTAHPKTGLLLRNLNFSCHNSELLGAYPCDGNFNYIP